MFRELVIGGSDSIMASAAQDRYYCHLYKISKRTLQVGSIAVFGHLAVPLSPVYFAFRISAHKATCNATQQVVTAVYIARMLHLFIEGARDVFSCTSAGRDLRGKWTGVNIGTDERWQARRQFTSSLRIRSCIWAYFRLQSMHLAS